MYASVWKWSRPNVKVAVGRRGDERRVDEPLHARRGGGVDRGAVQRDAVRVLARGRQEEHLDALERALHRLAVAVVARLATSAPLERRRPRGVAHDEPLLDPPLASCAAIRPPRPPVAPATPITWWWPGAAPA